MPINIESKFNRLSLQRFVIGNISALMTLSVVTLIYTPSTNLPLSEYRQQAYISDTIMILVLAIITYFTYKPLFNIKREFSESIPPETDTI